MALYRMKIHRIVSIMIICFLIISWSSMTLAFSDTDGHWASAAIEQWSNEYGIFLGSDSLFRPNAQITRSEMATLLNRIFRYINLSQETFADIRGDEWYADSISKLNAAGVMLGDGANANPSGLITREQAITMLARAFGITEDTQSDNVYYEDYDDISEWARSAVNAMTARGYVSGNGGRFSPKANLTRAEAVTIFDNILCNIYLEGGVYETYERGNILINSENPVVLRDMTILGDLYIAPGLTIPVTLDNVTIKGDIINQSGIEPVCFGSVNSEPIQGKTITYGSHEVAILENVSRNPYNDDLFYTDAGTGYMKYNSANYEVLTGIDVSSWQKDIDWMQVAAQDIDYVMLRVGYRGYTTGTVNLDSYFKQNIEGALTAGLKVGVYFFSQAITVEEALDEAEFVLNTIQGYDISFPVVFDWEPVADEYARTNSLDTATLCNAANAFCAKIEAGGYIPMVYFNLFAGYLKYDLSSIMNYDFWLAQYASTPTFYYNFTMWQYTSSGVVNGISGGVDMNISFIDYSKR